NASAYPSVRDKLANMNWNFVNLRWADAGRRDLLRTALDLEKALYASSVRTPSLLLALARTQFWLGVSSNGSTRKAYYSEAAALFADMKPSDQETRLQQADVGRANASIMVI